MARSCQLRPASQRLAVVSEMLKFQSLDAVYWGSIQSSRSVLQAMVVSFKPFNYDPLDLNSDQFRLLHVKGFDEHGRIDCILKHRSIKEQLCRYTAVSYTWGPEGDESFIKVNSKMLKVRRNIYSFLLQIARCRVAQPSGRCGPLPDSHRSAINPRVSSILGQVSDHTEMSVEVADIDSSFQDIMSMEVKEPDSMHSEQYPRIEFLCDPVGSDGLWIDAICLNQEDDDERNHQVRRMFDIYQSASSVLVWLGSGNPKITRWMSHIGTKSSNISIQQSWNYPALYDLLRLDYWSRAWIVQELIASQRIVLVYDRFCISWGNLWSANRPLSAQRKMELTDAYKSFHIIEAKRTTRHSFDSTLESTLAWLSQNGFECTNSRDRIYSLRSIVRNGIRFHVDYDENIVQLAFRSALFFGENPYAISAMLRYLRITKEKWRIDIRKITFKQQRSSYCLKMRQSCCALPIPHGKSFASIPSPRPTGDIPYFQVTRLIVAGHESRCSFCNERKPRIWSNLPISTFVMCFTPASPDVHFFCVPRGPALGNDFVWLGPVRSTEDWTYGEIKLINATRDQQQSRLKRSFIDQITYMAGSWSSDWLPM